MSLINIIYYKIDSKRWNVVVGCRWEGVCVEGEWWVCENKVCNMELYFIGWGINLKLIIVVFLL